MTKAIIYERGMVNEIFAAALLSHAQSFKKYQHIPIKKEVGFEGKSDEKFDDLVIVGNYIKKDNGLEEFEKKHLKKDSTIIVFLSSKEEVASVKFNIGKACYIYAEPKQSMIDVVCETIQGLKLGGFLKNHKKLIQSISQYCTPGMDKEVQYLMDGVYSLVNSGKGPIIDHFIDLLDGTLNYDDLVKEGKHRTMEKENLINSIIDRSAIRETKHGKKIAFFNCGFYIGMSHKAMVKYHKQCDGSVVYYHVHDVDQTKDKWQFSLRSYNKDLNVGEIARDNGGGGASNAAGFGSLELETVYKAFEIKE